MLWMVVFMGGCLEGALSPGFRLPILSIWSAASVALSLFR